MVGTRDFDGAPAWRPTRRSALVAGCAAFAALFTVLLLLLPGVPRDTAVTAYAVDTGSGLLTVQFERPSDQQLRRVYVEEADDVVILRAVVSSDPWRPWAGADQRPPVVEAVSVLLPAPLDGRQVLTVDGTALAEQPVYALAASG
jgi:hypothetical protein